MTTFRTDVKRNLTINQIVIQGVVNGEIKETWTVLDGPHF
jgi:hypothetical protein